jgi:hypothetical protein
MPASTYRPLVARALAVLAMLALGPAGAWPQAGPLGQAGQATGAQKPAEPPPAPTPQPIPLPQVFRAADELREPLRKAEAAAQVDAAVEEVERHLAAPGLAESRLAASLEPARLQEASAREIEGLRQALAHEDLVLADSQAVLEKRTTVLEGALEDLRQRQATWGLTGEAARKERAPPAVLRRIAQAEQDLRVAETRLRTRLDRLLDLQGRVSDLRAEVVQAAASVDQAEAALDRQLFEVESAPLWRALGGPERAGTLAQQLRQALREGGREVGDFLAEPGRLWIHLTLVVVLALALVAVRRPMAALAAEDESLRGAVKVLSRPASAALVLSVLWVDGLFPSLQLTVRDLLFVAILVPLVRLLRVLLPDLFRGPIYGLAALFALDRLAGMAPPRTLLARLAALAVTGGALLVLLRGLRRGGWARFLPAGPGAWSRGAPPPRPWRSWRPRSSPTSSATPRWRSASPAPPSPAPPWPQRCSAPRPCWRARWRRCSGSPSWDAGPWWPGTGTCSSGAPSGCCRSPAWPSGPGARPGFSASPDRAWLPRRPSWPCASRWGGSTSLWATWWPSP